MVTTHARLWFGGANALVAFLTVGAPLLSMSPVDMWYWGLKGDFFTHDNRVDVARLWIELPSRILPGAYYVLLLGSLVLVCSVLASIVLLAVSRMKIEQRRKYSRFLSIGFISAVVLLIFGAIASAKDNSEYNLIAMLSLICIGVFAYLAFRAEGNYQKSSDDHPSEAESAVARHNEK